MKKIFILFCIIPLLLWRGVGAEAYAQNYSRVKIFTDGKGLKELSAAGVGIDHGDFKKNTFFISDFSETEINIMKQKGFKYEIQIDDVQQFYQEQNNPSSDKYVPVPSPLTHGCNNTINYSTPVNFTLGSMGGYFTYTEILWHLDNMATLFPNLVKAKIPISGTNSIEGRPIYWLKISDNPNVNETEPEMLYTALHHAREPNSVSQMIMYMYYLLENYNSNSEIKYLVDNLEMYFVPCINPDGYWGFDNIGSSPSTSSDTYRGVSAFSEPETQNMRDFCNARQFKLTLNYHTYGNLLIYPWGYDYSTYTPDSAAFVEFGKHLTCENHYHYGTADQTVGYIVNGSSDDWMYGEQISKPKIFAMTPEAGDVANGFWPPQNLIISICKENITQNIHAAHLLLKHAVVADEEPRYISQNGFFNYNIKCLGMDVPATGSIADSPSGNYNGNATTSIRTTTAINLTGAVSATLSFRARWEIEPRFDYVEVMASTDNGNSYTALCGKYTKPGNAYQDNLEPIYDGFNFSWVREEINLDNYVNQNLLIRFMLKSDNGSEYDGFFFDDLKVEAILLTTSVNDFSSHLNFSIYPNPSSGKFQLAVGNIQLAKIQITDVLGNEIYKSIDSKKEIDLSGNSKGIYFIKVSDENGNFGVGKIVLQ